MAEEQGQEQGQGQGQGQGQEQGQEQKTPSIAELVPEEFKDKPWVKENTKTPEDFFKFVDNQNTLVGKKGVVIPEEGASEEELNKYFKGIGRPDSPDGYEFSAPEGKDRNADLDKPIKDMLHKNGVPKSMATSIVRDYEALIGERVKEQDEVFEKVTSDFFGDKKEDILTNARKELKGVLNEKSNAILEKMDSEQLAMVVAITDGIYSKYANRS